MYHRPTSGFTLLIFWLTSMSRSRSSVGFEKSRYVVKKVFMNIGSAWVWKVKRSTSLTKVAPCYDKNNKVISLTYTFGYWDQKNNGHFIKFVWTVECLMQQYRVPMLLCVIIFFTVVNYWWNTIQPVAYFCNSVYMIMLKFWGFESLSPLSLH